MPKANSKRKRLTAGLTLVELSLSLAISAILLLAIAVAVQSYAVSYKANSDLSTSLQAARVAMLKICSQLRQAADGEIPSSNTIFVNTNSIYWDVYALDSSGNIQYYPNYTGPRTLPLSTSATHAVLARNVSALTITGKSDGSGYLVNAQVRMTVSLKNGAFTLSDSAVLRRNRQLPDDTNPNPAIPNGATYVNPPPL